IAGMNASRRHCSIQRGTFLERWANAGTSGQWLRTPFSYLRSLTTFGLSFGKESTSTRAVADGDYRRPSAPRLSGAGRPAIDERARRGDRRQRSRRRAWFRGDHHARRQHPREVRVADAQLPTSWRELLGRQVSQARLILRALLPERFVFALCLGAVTPAMSSPAEGRWIAFSPEASLQKGVEVLTGFEPVFWSRSRFCWQHRML